MSAEYPAAVATFRTIENRPGVTYDESDTKTLFAEDLQKTNQEIVAVQTELGVNAKGSAASVSARIAALNAKKAYASADASGTGTNGAYSDMTMSNAGGNSLFSIVSNRLKYTGANTIKVKIFGRVGFTAWAATNARLIARVMKNGNAVGADALDMGFESAGGEPSIPFMQAGIITLVQNDALNLNVYQASGANRTLTESELFVQILEGLPE